MLAQKDKIKSLLPQGPPMLMVDSLIDHDTLRTVSGFTVEKSNLFVSENKLTESGLIENMAQSAALRTGWAAIQENTADGDFKPPIGVIGSVKNFKLYRLPIVNSRLETEILVQTEVFNATIIKANIRAGNDLVAEAELKIFITQAQKT